MPHRQIAITKASVTSCAVIAALIDQPTTRREKTHLHIAKTEAAQERALAHGQHDDPRRSNPNA